MWDYSYQDQKAYRELSQEDVQTFAKKTGLSVNTIKNIENGKTPNIKSYLAIINAYNLKPGIFFKSIIPLRNDK